MPAAILTDRFHQGQRRLSTAASLEAHAVAVLFPLRQIGDNVDREESSASEHAGHRFECTGQVALTRERLKNPVRGEDGAEPRAGPERKVANVATDEDHAPA